MLTVSECLQAYLKAKDGMIVSHDRAQFAVQKLEARIGMEAVGKGLFNATTRYARQRGHEVTASTIRRELNVLKASLHHAVKTGRIEYVPSLYETKAGSPRMRVLNDREIAALMNEVNSNRHPAWLRNFVILLLLTGQRMGQGGPDRAGDPFPGLVPVPV
jgi:integrase